MTGITNDAKRKWEEFSKKAENDAKEGADFTSAKQCRMELLHQQSTSTVEAASKHQKQIHDTVNVFQQLSYKSGGQWTAGDAQMYYVVFSKDAVVAKPRDVEYHIRLASSTCESGESINGCS